MPLKANKANRRKTRAVNKANRKNMRAKNKENRVAARSARKGQARAMDKLGRKYGRKK